MKHYNVAPDDILLCSVCGKMAVDIHHIVKRSQGGSDEVDNLIPLCRSCHDKAHFKQEPYLTIEQLTKQNDEYF